MGGLLSQLVSLKAQKEHDAFQSQLDMYKSVFNQAMEKPDSVKPGTLEMAANAIGELANSQLGGGKGKGQGKGGGIGDVFKGLLTLGAYNIYKQTGQERQRTQSAMTDVQEKAKAFGPISLSPEERLRIERAGAEEKNRLEIERAKGIENAKLEADFAFDTDPNRHQIIEKMREQDLKDAGVQPGTPEYSDYMLTGKYTKPAAAEKENSTERFTYVNPKTGEEMDLFRDPRTGKFYDEKNNVVDPVALKLAGWQKKETSSTGGDVGQLKLREEALAILDDPNATPAKKQAAKDTLKDLQASTQGKETRVVIENANAQDKREQEAAIPETVQGIMNGTIPPDRAGLGRNAGWLKIQSQLANKGFNLARAELDWKAAEAFTRSINSQQQIRLRETAATLKQMIPDVQSKYDEWRKQGLASGVRVFNKAALKASENLPGKAGEAARALDIQISDMVSELGQTYMGGNSPTDHALELAQKNLSGDWNAEQFKAALDLLNKNLGYRVNAIMNADVAGSSEGSPYNPPKTNPSPATSGGNQSTVDKLLQKYK